MHNVVGYTIIKVQKHERACMFTVVYLVMSNGTATGQISGFSTHEAAVAAVQQMQKDLDRVCGMAYTIICVN